MTTITYDSYKVVNILTEKGFTKEQAEGILDAVQEADISRVATKEDMAELRGEMKDLKADMYRFIITVAGVQIAAIGILIAAFKLF